MKLPDPIGVGSADSITISPALPSKHQLTLPAAKSGCGGGTGTASTLKGSFSRHREALSASGVLEPSPQVCLIYSTPYGKAFHPNAM